MERRGFGFFKGRAAWGQNGRLGLFRIGERPCPALSSFHGPHSAQAAIKKAPFRGLERIRHRLGMIPNRFFDSIWRFLLSRGVALLGPHPGCIHKAVYLDLSLHNITTAKSGPDCTIICVPGLFSKMNPSVDNKASPQGHVTPSNSPYGCGSHNNLLAGLNQYPPTNLIAPLGGLCCLSGLITHPRTCVIYAPSSG